MRSFKQRFAVVAVPAGYRYGVVALGASHLDSKSSFEAILSPVIESIGRYCLIREPKMRQSRRIFLARLGAVALAAQARSFHAVSSMADHDAHGRNLRGGVSRVARSLQSCAV